jgi:hypothetical protein
VALGFWLGFTTQASRPTAAAALPMWEYDYGRRKTVIMLVLVLRWIARLSGLLIAGGYVLMVIGEFANSHSGPIRCMGGNRTAHGYVRRDVGCMALGTAWSHPLVGIAGCVQRRNPFQSTHSSRCSGGSWAALPRWLAVTSLPNVRASADRDRQKMSSCVSRHDGLDVALCGSEQIHVTYRLC